MPIVEWNDQLKTGVAGFDDHHRHLFRMLNSAFDSFVAGKHGEPLGRLLDELTDYATYHFTAEESWMASYNYPGSNDHKQEHAYFVKRLTEIRRDHAEGKRPVFLEVLTFLKNWLTHHILTSDADYGRFAARMAMCPPFQAHEASGRP